MAHQLTLEQCCKIAAWQEVFQSPTAIHRKFEKVYGHHTAPTDSTIYAIHSKFLERGSVLDKPHSRWPAITTIDENTKLLKQAFLKSQRAALELSINKSFTQRMLWRVIKLYLYQHQVIQRLQVEDYDAHVEMCESLLYHYQNDSQFLENLWFNDESIFHLSGQVN
uniref:Uncharacterized protein n=1 Tax=Octopus bimaculoides TaxID=37653 RepID=A0A0L8GEI3_OCTBM